MLNSELSGVNHFSGAGTQYDWLRFFGVWASCLSGVFEN